MENGIIGMEIQDMLESLYAKWEHERDEQFIRLLERSAETEVLDPGCGDGSFTRLGGRERGADRVYGADTRAAGLKEEAACGPTTIDVDLAEGLSVDDSSFDVVVSYQVIEHLWRPVQFLAESSRVLWDDGYCLLSTENRSSWENVAALVLGRSSFFVEFDEYAKHGNRFVPRNGATAIPYPPHMRISSYDGLLEALASIGFEGEEIRGSEYLSFNSLSDVNPVHARLLTAPTTPLSSVLKDGLTSLGSRFRSRPVTTGMGTANSWRVVR